MEGDKSVARSNSSNHEVRVALGSIVKGGQWERKKTNKGVRTMCDY